MPTQKRPYPIELTGPEILKLQSVLGKSMNTPLMIQQLLLELDIQLNTITNDQKILPAIILDTILYVQAMGRVEELVEAAYRNRLNNKELFNFAKLVRVGLAPQSSSLEKILANAGDAFNVVAFRNRLAAIEGQVCRVGHKGKALGTGFLIGASTLITNYHVLQGVIEKRPGHDPERIEFLFDFKQIDEQTIHKGKIFNLDEADNEAQPWLIDHSPASAVDEEAEPKSANPDAEELDYAIVRLAGEPGDEAVGLVPNAISRGYIKLPNPDDKTGLGGDSPLFIIQHARGEALRIAVGTVRAFNDNETRVTYKVNTEGGASGSPCFDGNWQLVALHHSGDPKAINPEYNEGIPIERIVALLEQREKLALIE